MREQVPSLRGAEERAMLSEEEVSAAAVCLRCGGLEVKRKCKRLQAADDPGCATAEAIDAQKWPGVVVVAGCGSGAGRRKRSHCAGLEQRRSGSRENQDSMGTQHAIQGHTIGQQSGVVNPRNVHRYTGQARRLGTARVDAGAASSGQAHLAAPRADAGKPSGLSEPFLHRCSSESGGTQAGRHICRPAGGRLLPLPLRRCSARRERPD